MRDSRGYRLLPAALLVGLVSGSNLQAARGRWGELQASFDSTLSAGFLYRINDPAPYLFSVSSGGTQFSANTDDGNLNYDRGLASQVVKGTHELELKWRNFGAFARGTYFYDYENARNERARTPLPDETLERAARGAQFLDAYVRGSFEVGGKPLDLRVGRQVLNFGESSFIPNGLNVVNPVDVSRLRTPGSEVREALLPVNMLRASYGLSDAVSIGTFWQLEYRRTEIDPTGSYFSTNDFAGRGGRKVMLGFGQLSDLGTLGSISRAPDHKGNKLSQYGADLKVTLAGLNETEVGVYFANYHSRLPLISAITPTGPINANLTGPLTAVFQRSGLDATTAAAQAAGLFQLIVLSQTNPGALTPTQLATLQAPTTQAAIAGARQIALFTAAGTGKYRVEYPEDIKSVGVSFNTSLGSTGIAWQGEVGVKLDAPLQIDDVELLFAALSALDSPGGSSFGANNQVGNFRGQYGRPVAGFIRKDLWTAQTTFTKVVSPILGASQMTLLAEFGAMYVPDAPDKSRLRLDGNGTSTSGNQAAMNAVGGGVTATPSSAFADRFSWGYQALARLEYNNVLWGANFLPAVSFSHDVSGNSPLPYGNYLKDRKSINVVAEFNWLNAWSWELRYVNFFGAKNYNLIGDRDFVSTTLKYSF